MPVSINEHSQTKDMYIANFHLQRKQIYILHLVSPELIAGTKWCCHEKPVQGYCYKAFILRAVVSNRFRFHIIG